MYMYVFDPERVNALFNLVTPIGPRFILHKYIL